MALTKLPKAGLGTGQVDSSKIEDGTVQNLEFEDTTLLSLSEDVGLMTCFCSWARWDGGRDMQDGRRQGTLFLCPLCPLCSRFSLCSPFPLFLYFL